jgi:hypothetical protein
MRQLLINEAGASPERLCSVLHYDGMPIGADAVLEGIRRHLARGEAA